MPASQPPVTLHTLLATHAQTQALKSGRLTSPLVSFDFVEAKVVNRQFKPLVRELKYDVGELAVVTALQAKVYGKPYILLPATIVGRDQHHTIFYNADRGPLTAADLNGKRVGVRAYTQTTGTWVRGFLADDYGLDIDRVTWVTYEESHLAEYTDPPIVQRAPEGKDIRGMLMAGEIDAAILGDVAEDGAMRRLIPDADVQARRWARTHGGVPINHLALVRTSIAEQRPDVVREVYRLLKESRALADLPSGDDDPLRFGVAGVRRSLAQIVEYALRQRLIPRAFTVDELFAEATAILGEDAR